ncbi:MAG: hypothetical protein K2G93_04045 [Rikenella sp.]|nr:hypothetical protein [Rikenella sp.]
MADELDIKQALASGDFVREADKMREALGLVARSGDEMSKTLQNRLMQIGTDIDTLIGRWQQMAQTMVLVGNTKTMEADAQLLSLLQTSYRTLSDEVAGASTQIETADNLIANSTKLDQRVSGLENFLAVVKSVDAGLDGLSGAFGIAQNTAALFGVESNQLVAVLQKLQQIQGVVNGVEQVSNTLRKEGAVRTTLMPTLIGAWSRAQQMLTVQLGLSNAAAKALMFSGIGLIIGAIGGLITLYSNWKTKQEEAREEQRLLAEQNKKFAESVSDHASQPLAAYRKLQEAWKQLSIEQEKRKFIDQNAESFRQLGLAVNDVADAENILVTNTDAVVEAFRLRAKAKAAESLAVEAYKEALTAQVVSEESSPWGGTENNFDPTRPIQVAPITMDLGPVAAADATSMQVIDPFKPIRHLQQQQWETYREQLAKGDSYIQQATQFMNASTKTLADAGIQELSSEQKRGNKSSSTSDIDGIILDNTLKLEAERLALLEDGKQKRLDLIELERRQKLALLAREQKELADRFGGNLPAELTNNFRERESIINTDADRQSAAVDAEYQSEFAEREKELTAILCTEEEKRRATIKERYEAQRRWVAEALKEGRITQEESERYKGNLDKAEVRETFGNLVPQYRSREEEIKAIVEQSAKDQEELRKKGYEAEAAALQKKTENELSALALQDDSVQTLLGSLDEMTVSEIDKLIDEIQTKLNSGELKLNEVDTKQVVEGLQSAKQRIIAANPFKGLADSIKDIFKKGTDGAEESSAEIKNKWENLGQSTQGCFDFINDAIAGCEVLSDAIGDSGKASIQIVQSVIQAGLGLSAAIKTVETSSIILTAISAALSVATALFALFNDDQKHEKRIQQLQEEIDQLSYSYDRLGRSAKQTYFTNSEAEKQALKEQREAINKQLADLESKNKKGRYSDQIKELKKELQDLDFKGDVYDQMDAQAANLQQQQLKIQQQIAEEQAKKKTDQSKITEWEQQIQDLKDKERELERQRIEMLAGTDIKSAIDDFAEALTEAYAKGEDGAEALGETTRKVLSNAVKEALKKQFLAKGIEEAVNYLGNAMKDGQLSDEEKREFERMARAAGEQYMAGLRLYDDLFLESAATESQPAEGMRGEISEKITEQTASRLEGLFRLGVDLQTRLASLGSEQLAAAQSSLVEVADIARTNIAIEENTRRTADNTDGLRERLDTVAAELRAIKNNTENKQVWAQ